MWKGKITEGTRELHKEYFSEIRLFNIEPSRKNPLLDRFVEAVRRYQEHLGEDIETTTMVVDEKTIDDIERCVKEDIRLEELWPELKTIRDKDDL